MHIIAVDPGGTTGLAFGDFVGGESKVSAHELTPFQAAGVVHSFAKPGEKNRVDLVVCESFTPRPGVRSWQPEALYTIGAIKYLCEFFKVPFELQSPANAKSFATNDKLKKLGWYTPSKGGHMNDALRHLLLVAARYEFVDLRGMMT